MGVTVTNEMLAILVTINICIIGINGKFLFELWADLKSHKNECNAEFKRVREDQSSVHLGVLTSCRQAQDACQAKIISYIKQEGDEAKAEARSVAASLKEATEVRNAEITRLGRELRDTIQRHISDTDIHVQRNHGDRMDAG